MSNHSLPNESLKSFDNLQATKAINMSTTLDFSYAINLSLKNELQRSIFNMNPVISEMNANPITSQFISQYVEETTSQWINQLETEIKQRFHQLRSLHEATVAELSQGAFNQAADLETAISNWQLERLESIRLRDENAVLQSKNALLCDIIVDKEDDLRMAKKETCQAESDHKNLKKSLRTLISGNIYNGYRDDCKSASKFDNEYDKHDEVDEITTELKSHLEELKEIIARQQRALNVKDIDLESLQTSNRNLTIESRTQTDLLTSLSENWLLEDLERWKSLDVFVSETMEHDDVIKKGLDLAHGISTNNDDDVLVKVHSNSDLLADRGCFQSNLLQKMRFSYQRNSHVISQYSVNIRNNFLLLLTAIEVLVRKSQMDHHHHNQVDKHIDSHSNFNNNHHNPCQEAVSSDYIDDLMKEIEVKVAYTGSKQADDDDDDMDESNMPTSPVSCSSGSKLTSIETSFKASDTFLLELDCLKKSMEEEMRRVKTRLG